MIYEVSSPFDDSVHLLPKDQRVNPQHVSEQMTLRVSEEDLSRVDAVRTRRFHFNCRPISDNLFLPRTQYETWHLETSTWEYFDTVRLMNELLDDWIPESDCPHVLRTT